jgi:hypothetical protein
MLATALRAYATAAAASAFSERLACSISDSVASARAAQQKQQHDSNFLSWSRAGAAAFSFSDLRHSAGACNSTFNDSSSGASTTVQRQRQLHLRCSII